MIASPSILSANFNNLQSDINIVEENGADFLHLDIMDGYFVPNFTFGPVVLEKIKTNLVKDVHLMVNEPVTIAKYFMKIKPDYITYHYEAVTDQEETIKAIKELGVKVGVSIKPNTKVEVLDNILPLVDLVLVMSVEPGFGGQSFMSNSLPKISYLKEKKNLNKYNYIIEVDGGINEETAKLCSEAGCEAVVAGTYIFNYVKENDIEGLKEVIKNIKEL